MCAISLSAIKGTENPRTIRLRGFIGTTEVLMLVDSGSSHCFINEHLATQIPGWKPLSSPVKVQVENGTVLWCSYEIPDLLWGIQGLTFKSTFKIIPLGSYDVILGMDWLESYSPMQVHWLDKWLQFQLGTANIKI